MEISRDDLRRLTLIRLEDASLLFTAARWSGAYYLAGYAVELGLKACIAKTFVADSIPDRSFVNSIFTHNLDALVKAAGLAEYLKQDCRNNAVLGRNWLFAKDWNEASRYRTWSQLDAETMVDSVGNDSDGVVHWVRQHW
jgi:HEPN domain-containing protein